MQEARVRWALLAICLICLVGSGVVLVKGHQSAPAIVISPPPTSSPPVAVSADTPAAIAHSRTRIYVDVAGAVQRPSVYLLPANSRVIQAVMAAGGPTAAADTEALNLAQAVTDGEKVFVPKRGAEAPPIRVLPIPAAAAQSASLPVLSAVPHAKAGKGSGSQADKVSAATGELIGLNSATLDQLERLPGVGPSMAARILAYRQEAGGFGKVEDLTLVTGIGPKKLAKIAPFVTLN